MVLSLWLSRNGMNNTLTSFYPYRILTVEDETYKFRWFLHTLGENPHPLLHHLFGLDC
jgi:hypothetical protein